MVLALLVAGSSPAAALDPAKRLRQYIINSWSDQTGLPQTSIMGVSQTNDGFLWLATEEGLVRFDGANFTTFNEINSPGLIDRFVRSLAPAEDGGLWIGTRSGIVLYRNGVFRSFRENSASSQGSSTRDIYDLCAGRDGSVWSSSDEGLHRLKGGRDRVYTTADGLPGNEVTAIVEAPDGSIWAGTRTGLVHFENERFRSYSTKDGLSANSINTLSVGPSGALWIGTVDGKIERFYRGEFSLLADVSQQRGARVEKMLEDRDGNLWVAFRHLGLGRIQGKKLELFTKQQGLPSNDPDWIFEDREHILWIGWSDSGLTSIRDGAFTGYGVPEGLSSDNITSVIEATDGSVWAGTDNAGVNRIRKGRATVYAERNGLGGNDVRALMEARDGSIWTGSAEGTASRILPGSIENLPTKIKPPPGLDAILQARSGEMWFAFESPGGFGRLRNSTFDYFHFAGRPRALAESPDGVLWIASYEGGLVRFQDGKVREFIERDGLSSSKVVSVYADSQGTVWAGTALAGLNRLKNGRIRQISTADGLFDSSVGAIVEDNSGFLWMTSSRGISRTRKQELNDFADGKIQFVHSESYSTADGLRSRECTMSAQPAAWKGGDGRLWFATMGGVASIDPGRVGARTPTASVVIDSVSFNQKTPQIPVNGTRIEPGNRRLEIAMAVPAFASREHVRIRYRLAGFDREWTYAKARLVATYTNLPPGGYRFAVQAADTSGGWTPESTFDFILAPLFYQTWWFRAASLGLLCLAAWRVYTFRIAFLVARTSRLEEIVSRRTAELRQAVLKAEQAQELLREQAIRDPLTGLFNRRATFDLLDRELARCQRVPSPLSLLMLDLDNFKTINDTRGHLVGDQVLIELATRMQRDGRASDIVGRYGGEELMIVLPDCGLADAIERAEQIRLKIAGSPFATDSGELAVTCSIGVAETQRGGKARQLVGDADAALYRAKHGGRNRVCVHSLQKVESPLVLTTSTPPLANPWDYPGLSDGAILHGVRRSIR